MTKVGNLELASAILCEDVRQEKSEKLILVGVYTGGIFVEKVPAEISLALYVPGVAVKSGITEVHVRYSGPGKGKAIILVRYDTSRDNEPLSLVMPRLTVQLECEGTFRIDVSSDRSRWKNIVKRDVRVKQGLWSITPSIASEPPSEQSPPSALH